MDTHAIRITIELPQQADPRAIVEGLGNTATGVGGSASIDPIDAGSPSAALIDTFGDPEVPPIMGGAMTEGPTAGTPDAIDAGAFSDRLAADIEAAGPRHPLGHPEIGMLAAGPSAILSREARN